MKILLITGPLYPQPGNNANLILKVMKQLAPENEIHILSASAAEKAKLPKEIMGFPVHWADKMRPGILRRAAAKIIDRNGYSDYIQAWEFEVAAKKLRAVYDYDAVVSTTEPFSYALAGGRLKGVKKLLYIMDPPDRIVLPDPTPYRKRNLKGLLENHDCIITTPFIKRALCEGGFGSCAEKIAETGFPMICDNSVSVNSGFKMNKDKINLLFCGWLYSEIRSPKYFLKLAEELDERFCIYFMGRECDKLSEKFEFKSRAQIITLPQQAYETALSAMEQADVLINIGNSIPVHMPSKTLEYINTGKPIVNFYKMPDCPTLYYTGRYSDCLNLYEQNPDISAARKDFVNFCLDKRGSTVGRDRIKEEYYDCTPEYISKIISERLGEKHGKE